MTRDPAEGVDADGYLVTGAGLTNVPPAYRPVIADCVAALTAFPELDGLYLYGSVATGRARPPDSDLDLLALWTSTVDASTTVAALSARHAAVVREVGLAEAGVDSLADEADRCFLKHYCVPLAGRDRRVDLPRLPARPGSWPSASPMTCRLSSLVCGPLWTGATPAEARRGAEGGPAAAARRRRPSSRSRTGPGPPTGPRLPPCWPSTIHSGPTWPRRRSDVGRGSADVADLLALGDWLVRDRE